MREPNWDTVTKKAEHTIMRNYWEWRRDIAYSNMSFYSHLSEWAVPYCWNSQELFCCIKESEKRIAHHATHAVYAERMRRRFK